MKEKGRGLDLDLQRKITVSQGNIKRRKSTRWIDRGTIPIETSIETGEISIEETTTRTCKETETALIRSIRAVDESDRVQPTVGVARAAEKAYWSQRVYLEKR